MTSLKGIPLLEMQGEIDHSNCSALESAFDDALDRGSAFVLLDLTHVSYIDSGGLCVLLSACRRVRDSGWLGVIGPNHNVRRLLEIVGLMADPAFKVFDDRRAAESALPAGATT